MVSDAPIQLCPCSAKAGIDNLEINKHNYVPVKLNLGTLKSEFYIISTRQNIPFFF